MASLVRKAAAHASERLVGRADTQREVRSLTVGAGSIQSFSLAIQQCESQAEGVGHALRQTLPARGFMPGFGESLRREIPNLLYFEWERMTSSAHYVKNEGSCQAGQRNRQQQPNEELPLKPRVAQETEPSVALVKAHA
jgi:hypothetical protein